MAKASKICFDKILPWELQRPHRMRVDGTGRKSAVAPIRKQWVNGSTLRLKFLDGSKDQQKLVKKHAMEWTKHANLKFVFTDDPNAEVRISFDARDGAWSYIGLDNKSIPTHAATMNLGWVDRAVILHEFGHMIGLAHEHSNIDGGIVWDEPVVIAALAGPPNFWSEDQVRHNVFQKYSADQVNGTKFDPESIMLYAFPGNWTKNMPGGTQSNGDLSDIDKAFIAGAKMYPGRDTASVEAVSLPVFQPVGGAISHAGEEDLFTFSVEKTGKYTVETNGGTDLYLTLFGPESTSNLIAEDDDGGFGRNPRVEQILAPGTYYARVRHFDQNATGSYQIQVVASL